MRIHRISGVRLDPGSPYYAAQFDVICQNAMKLGADIFTEALKEPYLFYDFDRKKPLGVHMSQLLMHGEMFFPEYKDKIIGYAAFKSVYAGMYASLEIFVSPEHRKSTIVGEFISALSDAAFKPFPEGLQLHKVKGYVHPDNTSCLKTCKNLGFFTLCKMPFEGLFNGAITPMLYLELYAPEIRKVLQPQVIENGKRPKRTRSNGSELRVSSGVRKRAVSEPTVVPSPRRKQPVPVGSRTKHTDKRVTRKPKSGDSGIRPPKGTTASG